MLIRFKDLYAIAHDPSGSNCSWNKCDLLCADIKENDIQYLKPLKYEYYEIRDDSFNCMLYEKEKFETFNLKITYEEFYKNMIYHFISGAYKKSGQDEIIFVYDDKVIETYGKNLYQDAIKEAIDKISKESNVAFSYEFKHIINVAPGEFIASETSFLKSVYNLYHYTSEKPFANEKNEYKKLVDARVYNKEEVKYPFKAYIVDSEIEKYRFKPLKFFTLVDINAYTTYYYTYSMNQRNVKLESTEKIDIGLMTIIEWIYEQSEKQKDIYFHLKSIFKELVFIPECGLINSTYGIHISTEKFYYESPIVDITQKLCDIKMNLLNKHRLSKKIIHTYNIESLSELKIKHLFLKQEIFNGQHTKLLESYRFLKDALEKNLIFAGSFTSKEMVDVETGKNHFTIRTKLLDYGYEYKYDIDTTIELFQ